MATEPLTETLETAAETTGDSSPVETDVGVLDPELGVGDYDYADHEDTIPSVDSDSAEDKGDVTEEATGEETADVGDAREPVETTPAQPVDAVDPAKVPVEAPPERKPFKLDLPEGEYPEELVKSLNAAFDGLQSDYQSKLEAMQQTIAPLAQHMQHQVGLSAVQAFDQQVENLGEEFVELFGKGGRDELARDSNEFTTRSAVFKELSLLQQRHAGQPSAPSYTALFKKAMYGECGEKLENIVRRRLEKSVVKRGKSHTARPTGHKAEPKTGREAAIEGVKAFKAERELGVGDKNADDEF